MQEVHPLPRPLRSPLERLAAGGVHAAPEARDLTSGHIEHTDRGHRGTVQMQLNRHATLREARRFEREADGRVPAALADDIDDSDLA